MPLPPVALAATTRVKKNAPAHRAAVIRLCADVKLALGEAKKADAKSCISFWGRVVDLSARAREHRKPIQSSFDDAELIIKHRKDLPEASGLLGQLRQLSDALDDLADQLKQLEKEARRISDKSSQLAKIKTQTKDPKLEQQFSKAFDAGMSALGVITILVVVYKKLASEKSSMK